LKTRILFAIVFVVGVILTFPQFAKADIIACVAKDGTVRIVASATSCLKNETALTWPATARIVTDENRISNTESTNTAQDSAISAIQQKNTQQDAAISVLQQQGSGGGVVVKDSQGQTVGKWLQPQLVFLPVGNDPLAFRVDSQGFAKNFGTIYYATPDCSGTIYGYPNRALGGLYEEVISIDGLTGYFPTLSLQQVTIQSYRRASNEKGALDFSCQPIDFSDMLGAVTTLDLSWLGYVPPFHLE